MPPPPISCRSRTSRLKRDNSVFAQLAISARVFNLSGSKAAKPEISGALVTGILDVMV